MKEEANTSHINQPYDQNVAKQDKAIRSQLFDTLRSSLNNTNINQWQIIAVLIIAVKRSKKKHGYHLSKR